MTTSPRTRLTCDRRGPRCLVTAEFDGTPREARARAKGVGWRHPSHPSLDLCPNCVDPKWTTTR